MTPFEDDDEDFIFFKEGNDRLYEPPYSGILASVCEEMNQSQWHDMSNLQGPVAC